MKRSLLLIVIVGLAAFALSGCGQVVGLVFEPNLYVDDVQIQEFDGQFAGVNIWVRNEGVWLDDVAFAVVLSVDQFADDFDYVVYQDEFNIGFKGDEEVSVQRAYMDMNGVPEGDYYVGVLVDFWDDVDETDERDNNGASFNTVFIGADGGGGDPVFFPDGFEPNDTFYTWANLGPGWNYANFHVNGDEDWFEVYQVVDMSLTIETRPGPDGNPIDTYVEVYNYWDEFTPMYWSGPAVNNYIYIPPTATYESSRVKVFSQTNEIGESELTVY